MCRAVLLAALLAGCVVDEPDVVEVELTGPAITATVAITVYGYDPDLADAPAEVVKTSAFAEVTPPAAVDFELTTAAETGYYLIVYGDVDGDGDICPGDLAQAYDDEGPFSFAAVPDEPVRIPMEVAAADYPCRPAFP